MMAKFAKHLTQHILSYLTAIWLTAFGASFLIVNSYVRILNAVYIVPPEQRWVCLQPLTLLYSGYIAGILAFWFLKPFKKPKADRAAQARAVIALLCTLAFNVAVVYFLSQNYLNPGHTNVVDDVKFAVRLAGGLSFLVAPINFYYFGIKMR